MDWMTIREAADQWQIPVRTVQYYCKTGKICDAVYFNSTWAIPSTAGNPKVKHQTTPQPPTTTLASNLYHLLDFKTLEAILEQYPYSLNVTRADGTMVFANSKFMEGTMEEARKQAIGHYNILLEPNLKKWGLADHVKKAFMGEVITTKMLKLPNKELVDIKYSKSYGFVNLYQDLTSFPIRDEKGHLIYVVTFFVPSQISFERAEIMAAKIHIDQHWVEPLSIDTIAKSVNLSASRLSTLFKAETGFTLHDYYIDMKMQHLCSQLTHLNLSISEVFNSCGIAYNSHYGNLFKKHIGMSPSQYRKLKKRLD